MSTTIQPRTTTRWTKADAAALLEAQRRDLAQRYAADALANTPCPAWCVRDHAEDYKGTPCPDPEPDGDLYCHDSAELSGVETDEDGRVRVLATLNYTRAGVYNRKVDVYAERTLSLDEARQVAAAILKATDLLEDQR